MRTAARRGRLLAIAPVAAVLVLVPGVAVARGAPSADPTPLAASALPDGTPDSSLLVGVAPDTTVATQRSIAHAAGADRVARISPSVLEVQVAPGTRARRAAELRGHPDVRYVEANRAIHATATVTPDDPGYGLQWSLQDGPPAVGAPTAWHRTTGSASVVVGILDSGIDLTHPDLVGNLWSNPSGVGGCGVGTHGVNEVGGGCVPQDDNGHGTHVAGIVGAVGNNGTGVAGVNWTTRLMGIKVLDSGGNGTVGTAIAGIEFAVQAKVTYGVNIRVLNASWAGKPNDPPSIALRDAIQDAANAGILFVAAAGNDGVNVDALPVYPCSFHVANEICVAATTDSPADTLASFSNYGAGGVDVAAPGTSVVSTWLGGGYAYASGTSMAAPHVAGAAALMLAAGSMPVSTLRTMVLANAEPVPALAGKVTTGRRLDLACSVGAVQPSWCAWDTPAPPLSGGLTSAPAVASWGSDRLDAFARDGSGALVHTSSTGTFSTWEDLGGGLIGAPGAVAWGPGRLDVFVRGTDGQLWHKSYSGTWSGWEGLGGALSSAPAVSSWGPGRLDVFVRGTDGQLWHKWYSGTWSGWEGLGGALAGDPGAVSWSPGRVDVAVRGTDGQVWHKWYAGNVGWFGWEALGGQAVGGTALSSRGAMLLDVFVTGTDGRLWHKWYDGAWHGYENLGGSLASGPAAVSPAATPISVVARTGSELGLTEYR